MLDRDGEKRTKKKVNLDIHEPDPYSDVVS